MFNIVASIGFFTSMLYTILIKKQNCPFHKLSNGPRLVTQSKITCSPICPVLVRHRLLRFSDALIRGSCENNRNQIVTDAYQSDNVLAETQKERGFCICVIHGSRNSLDCSHQAAGLFRSGSRIVRMQLNQQRAQRT